jgi:hypothetical protein
MNLRLSGLVGAHPIQSLLRGVLLEVPIPLSSWSSLYHQAAPPSLWPPPT